MRKLTMAVMAVAGLSLVTGCRESVQQERQDVAEARQDVQQERQEMQQEIVGERQEGQEEIADERQDVAEAQQDLAEARQERMEEPQEGTGGGAMAGAQSVNGRVQSATPDALVLIIPEQNNQQMRLSADQKTQVKKNNQQATLQDIKPGDEIRASYEMGQNGQLILRDVEVQRSAMSPQTK